MFPNIVPLSHFLHQTEDDILSCTSDISAQGLKNLYTDITSDFFPIKYNYQRHSMNVIYESINQTLGDVGMS